MFRWNHTRSIEFSLASCALTLGVLAPLTLAQDCVKRVDTTLGEPGLRASTGFVNCLATWDPDGPGPRGQTVLAVGSLFKSIMNEPTARGLVLWDPTARRWERFPGVSTGFNHYVVLVLSSNEFLVGGQGFLLRKTSEGVMVPDVIVPNSTIYALAELPDGRIVAGGYITQLGGQPAGNLIIRDENGWKPFSTNFDGIIYTLTTLSDGSLLAGGRFTSIDGVPFGGIARWTGDAWEPLGDGLALDGEIAYVSAAIQIPNGDIIVGGRFDHAGGIEVRNIARWNGVEWSAFGEVEGGINRFALGSAGQLYAAGPTAHDPVTGERVLAPIVWNGTNWVPLGTQGIASRFYGIAALDDGSVYVATDTNWNCGGIAVWNGERWSGLDGGIGDVRHMTSNVLAVEPTPDGGFYAAGDFDAAGGFEAINVAFYDGRSWISLGEGLPGQVQDLDLAPTGDLYAVGRFQTPGDMPAVSAARWDGAQWHPLGEGLGVSLEIAYAVLASHSGDVYAAGSFSVAGNQPANRIARWDGEAWHPMGEGLSGPGYDLLETRDGDIIVAGWFEAAGGQTVNNIARWDGEQWHPLGMGLAVTSNFARVNAIAELPNGDIVAVGQFNLADGNPALGSARWDGTQWHAMGAGLSGDPTDLMVRSNGDLLAIGEFSGLSDGIVRWNGVAWESVKAEDYRTPPGAIAELADGDLVVGGSFEYVRDFDGDSGISSLSIARYTLPDCCLADWDSSGGAPDPNDYLAYLNDWSAHAPAADLAPAGGDGNWDSSDFLAFLNLFANGC
ncbi:MAG: GC-type dockerin domain-anchored protein [Phycisphaerales bacterium]|jgi:hypothetical protein|nr:GC-type dockerin domain-anchored protein [Phycisphaerales bacterium]